jgi:hypothetical protein
MQRRRLSAVRWLDITVANRSVGSLQYTWSGSLHSSEIVSAEDGWLGTERFIDEVKKRKAIFDSSLEEYKNINPKKSQWIEVCTVF